MKNSDLKRPISELGVQVRTINTLEERGILTVEDLLNTRQATLLLIPNFGSKTLQEVLNAIRALGFQDDKRIHEISPPWKQWILEAEALNEWFVRKLEDSDEVEIPVSLELCFSLIEKNPDKAFSTLLQRIEKYKLEMDPLRWFPPREMRKRLVRGEILSIEDWESRDPRDMVVLAQKKREEAEEVCLKLAQGMEI